MVTTTTSPSRARTVPSKPGADPAQLTQAPPCSQTMTGRLPVGAAVQTLSERQSSPSGSSAPYQAPSSSPDAGSCGAECPKALASRTPGQGVAGCGGRNRLPPAVLAAYGMPLKPWTPWAAAPRTLPPAVSTTAAASCAWARPPSVPAAAASITARRGIGMDMSLGSSLLFLTVGYDTAGSAGTNASFAGLCPAPGRGQSSPSPLHERCPEDDCPLVGFGAKPRASATPHSGREAPPP